MSSKELKLRIGSESMHKPVAKLKSKEIPKGQATLRAVSAHDIKNTLD